MLTSANRIIETPKIFIINAIYIPPETTKDILLKNALCLNKTIYLIRTNFGVEKIWRNWRFWSEIAKLSPRQI